MNERRVHPEPRPGSVRAGSRRGFTLVELLLVAAIFIVVLAALGTFLVDGLRAYRVTTERSEAIQDSEAVLQLMRYEVGMAGFRGLGAATIARPFTLGSGDEAILVRRPSGSTSDELTVRYFEDRYVTDSGERQVTFTVTSQTLVRQELRPGSAVATTELLVGNVESMRVVEIVDRERSRFATESLVGLPTASLPPELAGLNVVVQFVGGREWEFLIGISNPQVYRVVH